VQQLSYEDFGRMTLEEIHRRTGIRPPDDRTDEAIRAYRAKAYRSYRLDVARRDEWGTATQATEPPDDEDPEL
jgi:hypothetical protein